MNNTTLYKAKYEFQKEIIQTIITRNPGRTISDIAGIASLATGVHILIVCQFLGELTSFTPELIKTININKIFYKIDNIV